MHKRGFSTSDARKASCATHSAKTEDVSTFLSQPAHPARGRFCGVLALAAAAVLTTGMALGQEFRGTISGAVADPSGAVVPNAEVVIREVHTGSVNRTKSDGAGQYVVPFLAPGDYTVTATATGFKQIVRNNIHLDASGHPIVDLSLALGDAGEVITVSSAPPLIDQTNASVGTVIDTESVADLPLNGRTPTTFTELSPGVITTAAPGIVHPFDNNAGNAFSIGGTPNQVSEILLDGSPDLTLLGALAYAPTQDSVSQLTVRPFDTDASVGHTIGGVVNQVTKSGTNGLHGTVYEFNQIPNLDANLYFNGRAGTPTPTFHYNQYGLTVGGPVLIPKVFNGRDKLFFFFAFEGLKDSTPATQFTTVPTSAEKTGDFSQTLAAGCPGGFANDPTKAAAICLPSGSNKTNFADPNQLYNPFTATVVAGTVTRQAILNNQLTTAHALDPIALAYLKLYPAANVTTNVSATGQNNYLSNAPSVDRYNNEFGRLDYNLSARDHVFFDMRHNYRTQLKNDYFGDGATGTTLLRENYGATIDNVLTLNATTVLDTRFNWTRFNEVHGTPAQQYSPTSVGFPANVTSSSNFVQLPYLNLTGTGGSCGSFSSYQCLGDTTSGIDPTTSYQAFADVVKVLGKHTLKLGFDGRQYRLSVTNFGASSGSYTFGTGFVNSGSSGTTSIFGSDLASLELGLPTAGSYDNNARADYHSYYIGSFLQDDWRATDKLTLNMGLRFDIDTPFRDKLSRIVNGFDPTAVNTATGAAAKFASTTVAKNGESINVAGINANGGLTFPTGNDGAVYATNNGFLSPRFGFSYSVTPKTNLRGGFGIFVQPETLATLASTGTYSSSALSNQEGFSQTTSYVATNNNYQTPANTLDNPFPNNFVAPAGSSAGASTFLGQTISFLAPKQHDPYSERFDLGLQHSLTSSTLIEALYVGNHSLHLPIATQNINATKLQYLSFSPYLDYARSSIYGTSVTNPFAGLLPNASTSTGSNAATTALKNLIVPFPQFGSAAVNIQNQTIGQSYFHELILHVEQRAKYGLTLTANYSFSKLTEADTFLNDQDTTPTHRISPFDHTHHFVVGATYNLPFGRGKAFDFGGSRLADELLGGFVVNSIYLYQSGQPFVFSTDIPLQPGFTPQQITVNARNASPITSGTPALNTAAFVTGSVSACPTTGACDGSQFINGQYQYHYRTLPQTLTNVRQDGFNNLDASILKNFNFTEKAFLQLRFEVFNSLNRSTFAAPNVSSATASNFGYITGVASTAQPRQVQLGGRIVF